MKISIIFQNTSNKQAKICLNYIYNNTRKQEMLNYTFQKVDARSVCLRLQKNEKYLQNT